MTKKDIEELRDLLEAGYDTEEEVHIDFKKYFKILGSKRKHFFISIPIAFVVAILLTLGRPKYYVANVKLAPELSSMSSQGGGLNSIMRNLGLRNLSGSNAEGDAILPNLYPDLMNSQLFRVGLFDIPVESRDGQIKTTYYDYLDNYQKSSWMSQAVGAVFGIFTACSSSEGENATPAETVVDASYLNRRQTTIAKEIEKNVVCDVDEKTFVISLSVKAQDPVICATVADSTCRRLQQFIIEYRTKKAQVEYDHMLEQYNVSKQEYDEAKNRVAAYNNGNWDIVSESFAVEKQALQNQMQLKFSAFSTMSQQLLAARVKLDESRPVFTVLDPPYVPLKPAGPKRKGFVLGFVFLVAFVQSGWILWRENKEKKKVA